MNKERLWKELPNKWKVLTIVGPDRLKDTATDQEYFVHVSGLIEEVKENDEVTFDLKEGKKRIECGKC